MQGILAASSDCANSLKAAGLILSSCDTALGTPYSCANWNQRTLQIGDGTMDATTK
jgi:hypothetical protein